MCTSGDDATCEGNAAYRCVSIGSGEHAWEVEDCAAQGRSCELVGAGRPLAVCQ